MKVACHDRFMALGGLIVSSANAPRFESAITDFRRETRMFAELKWSRVTNQKFNEYRRFVEYFFDLLERNRLHFHCLILDNHQINHQKFSQGDKEIGFYKFYYQLLLHCFGRRYYLRPDDRFVLHLDSRCTNYKLETVLNNAMTKNFAGASEPFCSIEPRNSKDSELMQVNDIVLGDIGFQKNCYELNPDTRR
jgi:uncharacterized protein DUF3800